MLDLSQSQIFMKTPETLEMKTSKSSLKCFDELRVNEHED